MQNTDLSSIKSRGRRSYSHLDESIGRTIARYPGHLLLRFLVSSVILGEQSS